MFDKIKKSLFGEVIYYKKKKKITFVCNDVSVAKMFEIVGGPKSSRRGKTVTIDVSKVKDVDQALEMISVVTDVK